MKLLNYSLEKSRVMNMDDHPLVRRAIRQVIEAEPDIVVCGEAEDRGEALALIAAASPHWVIVGLSLKTSDDLKLVKDLRQRHPEVASLVISMHNESFYALRSVRAGANGYLSKQEPPQEVMKAIRRVLAGHIYWPQKIATETVNMLACNCFAFI